MVDHAYNLKYSRGTDTRGQLREKCETLSQKQTKAKMTGNVVQVVEHLPRKLKGLSSNERERERKRERELS
jgi:hypothetical protein